MSDELIDIINEQDRVTGQIMKSKAHKTGALHRTVIAELIDEAGQWLLVKQASDRQDAGQFVSPVGGHVGAGESERDAILREAHEEVGLINVDSTDINEMGKAIFNRSVGEKSENHLFILYEIKVDSNWIPTLNHESVGFQKFSLPEIKALIGQNSPTIGDALKFVINTFYK